MENGHDIIWMMDEKHYFAWYDVLQFISNINAMVMMLIWN